MTKMGKHYDVLRIYMFNHLFVHEEGFLTKVGFQTNFNFSISLSDSPMYIHLFVRN